MATNMCWTFGYGNLNDCCLVDRWNSSEVYMNPHKVVEKLKEIIARTKQEVAEHPDNFVGQVWFDTADDLITTLKPNSTRFIYMDENRDEWLSCREIKW